MEINCNNVDVIYYNGVKIREIYYKKTGEADRLIWPNILKSYIYNKNGVGYEFIWRDSNVWETRNTGLQKTDISKVEFSFSVVEIPEGKFNGCTSLSDITFSVNPISNAGIEEIGTKAFYDCSSLTQLIFPNTLRTIGAEAFYGCTNLRYVNIGEGLETIEQYAFGETGMLSITLPSTIKFLGGYLFTNSNKYKLNELIFNGSMAQWNNVEKAPNWKWGTDLTIVKCIDGNVTL